MVHAVQVVLGRAAQFWEAEGPIGPGANGYSGVAHTRVPRAGPRAGWVGQASGPPAACQPPARPLVEWKVYRRVARGVDSVQVGCSSSGKRASGLFVGCGDDIAELGELCII